MKAGEAAELTSDMYPDVGCRWSPSCLACPLPQCVHDAPRRGAGGGRPRPLNWGPILAARAAGELRAEVAARFGVTERTVSRITSISSREAA